ncbi:MFS transporter [Klebsiella pneumoniae]|nr:MFS transporter [Klebsiella pneumoniae]HBT1544761.1 MFS transporter [Klebsiella pneumoniae]
MSNPQDNTASILQKNKKVLIASLTGSAIEWFDYFLYGTAAALVFNKIFFPMVDPVIGLILSWLSFSLTFFIRPIGGVIFAHISDRIGRKKTLVLTLSLMGSATVAIGLLPTYEMVGLWAPALLIILRIIQGMGIGGEWGGALLLAYEYAPEKRKGFFGSIPQAGVTIGMLMATFIVSLMTLFDEAQFLGWGIMLATIVAFGILWAPVTAVLGTLCSEIFSANVRYTGITLGYQLGAALAGGTAPLIATGLLAKYDGDWRPVAIYLGVTVAISLLAIFCASRMKSALGTAPSRAESA